MIKVQRRDQNTCYFEAYKRKPLILITQN